MRRMSFAPGDCVHLAGIGTGTIIESRGGDRYAIAIKDRIVVASGRQLEMADGSPRTRARGGVAAASSMASPRGTSGQSAIDLHGRTAGEARAAVEAFINEALLSGVSELRIIHGRSGGRVKAAVHQYLSQLSAVAAFRLDPHNPGVTIVTFT
jgi:DNA mismatch repair protein MutS2